MISNILTAILALSQLMIISKKIRFNFLSFLKIKNKYDKRKGNKTNNNNLRESLDSNSTFDENQSERYSINSYPTVYEDNLLGNYNDFILDKSNIFNFI